MSSDQLNTDQIQALSELMKAVSIESPPLEETLRRSPRLAEDPKPKGFYKVGGGERLMRGGGVCEDNWVVKMAVDSAIVIGGIAASIGVSYKGYEALASFMSIFGLDKATVDSINAVYQIVKASSSVAYQVGASIIDVGSTGASAIGSAVPPVASAVGSVAAAGIKVSPFVALGRYIGTEQSALADLQSIYDSLVEQQAALQAYQGSITRSMSEKQTQLQVKLGEIKTAIDQYSEAAKTSAASISDTASRGFTNVQGVICNTIDSIKRTGEDAENAIMNALNPYYGLENIQITLGGRRRKRSRKNKKSKKSKKSKKAKKAKKTKKSRRRKTRKH